MGVFTGASSLVILHALFEQKRNHWGFDSFAGLSAPNPAFDGVAWDAGDLRASIYVTQARLSSYNAVLQLRQGWIPNVLDDLQAEFSLRLTHIDVDLHDPTAASLDWAAKRTVAGGLIVCDDYGFASCPGATKAVDDFLRTNAGWRLLHLTSGQGVLIAPQDR